MKIDWMEILTGLQGWNKSITFVPPLFYSSKIIYVIIAIFKKYQTIILTFF